MKIIFLDIDGVLNTQNYIIKNHERILKFYKDYEVEYKDNFKLHVDRLMLDIDEEKLNILKDIVEKTNAKIVIISSWKSLGVYDEVAKRLIEMGIPIIGKTDDEIDGRGHGIYRYLNTHNVIDYVILDDEIFSDYDENLLMHFVKTSFYTDGLTDKHAKKLIKMMNNSWQIYGSVLYFIQHLGVFILNFCGGKNEKGRKSRN